MIMTKRMLCIFLVVLMLFTSLPMNVFAEDITSVSEVNTTQEDTTATSEEEAVTEESDETTTEETTEYEVGKEYTVNGVRYKISSYNFAEVVGEGEGMSERIEIASHLGDYPVKAINQRAFENCKTLKEVILPETVTNIYNLSFSGSNLTNIEIIGKNVNVRTDFKNTPLYENPDNWQNGVLIVSGYAVMSVAEGSVVLDENIVGIGEHCFGYNSLVTNLTILNPECHIFNSSGTLPLYATIYGYKDSTAQKHAATFSYKFSALCGCEGTVFMPATNSYCNGIVGYSEGYWCDNCNTYSSGGFVKDATFDHTDLDSNGVCDFCKLTTDIEILDAGKCGDNAFWCLTVEGLLIVGGKGEVKNLDESTDVHLQKRRIKEIIFLDGITSIAVKAFDNTNTVEKITISDTVKTIDTKAFYQCFNLKEIILGSGLEKIGTQAFADSINLKKVTLNEGLTVIDAAAFSGCRGLEEINLPDSLETIEYNAFKYCVKLKDVVLPDGLKSIGNYAFIYCSSITEIIIPESVELLGQSAFAACSNLTDVEMKPKYLEIYSNAFKDTAVEYDNVNGFNMLGSVAFYETEPTHKELVLGEEITSLAAGWPVSDTEISEIYVLDKRCYIGSFAREVENLVVHGYKDSHAEAFAEAVGAFFDPICECENTEYFPATQGSCDGTVGYTAGDWCEYCQTWKTGHEINITDMHTFSEGSEFCLDCGESKESEIVSVGILTGGYWTLNSNNELVVYGKGTVSLPERTPDKKSWIKAIAEDAKSVRVKGSVEIIGKELFKNGTSLEKMEIENSVYSIGANAFYNCNSVKEMTLSVVLLEIGVNAFEGMSSLEGIILSDTVYKIGNAAFKNCTSLKSVTFEGEFYDIPSQLFYNCNALENVKFKNTYINNIGEYAFSKCKSLKTIPLSVKGNIAAYAFSGCEALKEVSIISPAVSSYAFKNCIGLETVNIDAATSMYDGVFEGCSSLKNVNFPEGEKVNMRVQSFKGCTSLESITLPETWSAIPQTFFYGCTSLKSMEIPESVKTIGASAFYGCSSLEKITLGEKVTAVNSMAFYGADSLSEITFLNKDAKIAAPQKVDEIYCNAIPVATLIKGYAGSSADIYADNYGNEFLPLDETKAVKEISVETYPSKNNYVLNKDTEVNLDNLTIKVTYEDETTRIFKSRFTVDTSECDLTKSGTYAVKITFEDKETFFVITVSDNDNPLDQNVVNLPEYGELNFKYDTTATVNVKFIPEETRTYYFMISGDSWRSMRMPDGTHKSFLQSYNKDFCKLEIDLVKGETYYITLNCVAGKSVTLKQTGICDIEELPDGTYKTVHYLGDKYDVVVPGEINGKKITVIGSNSFEGESIKNITLGEGIEVIEKNAFIKNNIIKSVTLPDSLRVIGEKAFDRLQTLEAVNGGKNVEEIGNSAFEYCTSLAKFTFSEKIKTIGNKAFFSCKLTGITLPGSLEKVGEQAFSQCYKLSEINFLAERVDFGYGVFSACHMLEEIVLPSGNTEIAPAMFSSCTGLTEIILPENIVSIGKSAFYNCNKVERIKINSGVRSIGSSAFSLCSSVVTVEIPETVTDFGKNIFSECDSLKEITFLGEITEIPEKMFYFCDGLERINHQGTITYVGDDAFRGCVGYSQNEILTNLTSIGNYAFAYSNLTEINLNEDITYLGDGAFAYTNIKSVVLPKSVTKIPSVLFRSSLVESVTLLGEVAEIGNNAFMYCKNLKEINIPSSVKTIGEEAFGYTKALEITVNLEGVREIGKDAFRGSLIKGVTFGNNLRNIADYAFAYTNIARVVIPEDVTVGMYAFSACDKLVEATVGENSAVDYAGFAWCDNLEKVIVEDGASLGSSSINGCKNLKELHFKNTISPEGDLGTVNSYVTVYGLEESNAHRYAERNGFKFVAYEGSAHIHNYQSELLAETKCNVYRKTRYYCSCGKEYTQVAAERTHVYSDFIIDKEPTCTEPGIKSKHCICGKTRLDITVIEPLGHTEVIDIPAVAPTSTEPGYTHQSHCSVCGETVVERELIAHNEYDIIIDDDVTAYKFDAATTENDGMNLVIIFTTRNNVCMSHIDKTVIYKVGEVKLSKTELTYNGKVQKPVVTVKDSTGELLTLNRDYRVTYSADSKYCGEYSVKVDYIGNYAGNRTLYYDIVHNWGVGKITKSPTCTKTGIKTFTCGCGVSYTETVAKLGHLYSNACDTICNRSGCGTKRTITHNYAAATCTTAKKCKVCGATSGSKLGHLYSNACDTTCNRSGCGTKRSIAHSYKSVTTKATLSKNGKVENKCSVCGKVSKTVTVYYPKSIKLSKTSYTYNGKVQTPSVSVKDSKGNTLKKDTDYTVKYESGRKAAGAYTVTITFKGKYIGTKKLTYTIAPKATSKITASQTTSTITLKWSKVTDADGYRVYQYNAKTKKWVKVKDVTGTSLKINKLTAGTKYKFRVKAYTKDDGTIWGAYSSTFETATKCKTPSIIKLTTTKGKASFVWSNVSGESGYQVYYSTKKDSGYNKVASYKANVVKGSKSKLKSGKKYYFKVRSYKKVDGKTVYSSFSSVKSIKIK